MYFVNFFLFFFTDFWPVLYYRCMVLFQAIFLVVMVILKLLMIDKLLDRGKMLKHTKPRLTLDPLREFYPLRYISKHRLQISLVIGDSSVALQELLTSLELKATCLREKKEARKVKSLNFRYKKVE
jgi:hypothetical protein